MKKQLSYDLYPRCRSFSLNTVHVRCSLCRERACGKTENLCYWLCSYKVLLHKNWAPQEALLRVHSQSWLSLSEFFSMHESSSIHPLLQVVAACELTRHLCRGHTQVLLHVLGILPLKELHAILCVRGTPKVSVGSRFLVFRLTQCQGYRDGSWTAVKLPH